MHVHHAIPPVQQGHRNVLERRHRYLFALKDFPRTTWPSTHWLIIMDQQQSSIRRPLLGISARLRQSVSASSELTGVSNGADQHGRQGSIQFRSTKRGAPPMQQQQDLAAQKRRTSVVPAGPLSCASPRTVDTGLSFRRGHLSWSAQPGFAVASPSISAASGPYIRRPLPHEDGAENCAAAAAVTSQVMLSHGYTCSGISRPRSGNMLDSASIQTQPSLQQGSAPAPRRLPILPQLACKQQERLLGDDAHIHFSAGVGSCNWDDEEDCDVWDDAVSRAPLQHQRPGSAVPVTHRTAALHPPSTLMQAMPDIRPKSEISRSHAIGTFAEPAVQPASSLCPASNRTLQAVQRHPGVFVAQVSVKDPIPSEISLPKADY